MGEGEVAYYNLSYLIDAIYDGLNFEHKLKLEETSNDDNPIWYYTSDVINQIMKTLHEAKTETIKDIFIKFLNDNKFFNNEGYYHFEAEDVLISNIVNNLNISLGQCEVNDSIVNYYINIVSKALAESFSINFKRCIEEQLAKKKIQNDIVNYSIFDNIVFLYRECMADVQMLALLRTTKIPSSYADEIDNSVDTFYSENSTNNKQRELTRRLLTLCAYNDTKQNVSTALFDYLVGLEINPITQSINRYIYNGLISYLKTFITNEKEDNKISQITEKIMMASTVQTVSTEIDSLINNYILDLAGCKQTEK